jgi:hypothetical protein
MKSRLNIRAVLGFVTVCFALVPGLSAQSSLSSKTGCGYGGSTTANLKPAAFVEVAEGNAIITGLWRFTLVAKGNATIPDGTVLDTGYTTWHADGTEIINSSRPPMSGNFCMGVWKQIKHNTFKLNHFAMGWDPTGATLIGPTNLRGVFTVDRSGNRYSGPITGTQYDNNGNVLGQVFGVIVAQRIAVD